MSERISGRTFDTRRVFLYQNFFVGEARDDRCFLERDEFKPAIPNRERCALHSGEQLKRKS